MESSMPSTVDSVTKTIPSEAISIDEIKVTEEVVALPEQRNDAGEHDADIERWTKEDDDPNTTDAAKQLNLHKRLKKLRKSVKILEKAIVTDYDNDSDSDQEDVDISLERRIRRSTPSFKLMTMESYQQRFDKNEFSFEQKHFTIDAVMTAGWAPSPMSAQSTTLPEAELNKSASKSVRFIQINSKALCAVLHKYARLSPSSADPPAAPSIMFAPFKPLCFYEEKLRQRLAELRSKYAGMTWETVDLAEKEADEKKDETEKPCEPQIEKQGESQIEKQSEPQSEKQGEPQVETPGPAVSNPAISVQTSDLPPDSQESQESLHTIEDFVKAEKQWPSVNYPVSWGGTDVHLRFSDIEHLSWTEVPNQPAVAAFTLNIGKIDSVERTMDTSSAVSLKIRYSGTWADDFIFISDTAQKDMEHLCDVLISLVKRCKLIRLKTGQSSVSSAVEKSPEQKESITDASKVLESALDASIAGMISDEKTLKEIDPDWDSEKKKLGKKLLAKVRWKPVEASVDDAGDESDLNGRGWQDFGENSFKAFEDLDCLMKFYDEYIKPSWEPVRTKSVKNVAFADLCMFFRPGDHIHIPEDEHKIWRVLQVTGARPKLDHLISENFNFSGDTTTTDVQKRSKQDENVATAKDARVKRSAESENWTNLYLDCYYIDFDGSVLGAMHRLVSIKYFPGRRDAKALKAYPIEWLRQMKPTGSDLKLLQNIRRSGERFDKLCLGNKNDRNLLFYYDGRTNVRSPSGINLTRVDESEYPSRERFVRSEDVSSHVVIDFDKTFQYNPGWQPTFEKPSLTTKDYLEGSAALYSAFKNDVESKSYTWESDFETTESDQWVKDDTWTQPDTEEPTNKRNLLFGDDWELLPDKVFGFVLRSRSWACLNIQDDQLTDVKEESTPWAELQIPQEHRITIQSLVRRHFDAKTATMDTKRSNDFDLIQGKGRGLIVLLHGAPGLGKTSTAESIAALYKKPLLPITCGNLGLDAMSVERALNENFELAQAWDCIVLLDEADVFLAQRENSDLARNALVSVFLRTLEYYSGILFLTTNRIGTFDEAFRSRIHSALFYKDLDRDSTKQVWKTNLTRLLKQKEHLKQAFKIPEPDIIVEYAAKIWDIYKIYQRAPWNGREIRNAFQTAVALAEFKASSGNEPDPVPNLTWENFQSVIMASQDFERYLIDTRGGETDYDRAGRKHLRKTPLGMSPADIALKVQQQQQVEAFTQALRAVNPHTIVAYPLPFSNNSNGYANAPGPGSFERKMTINDMISSNPSTQQSNYAGGPNGGYQQMGANSFQNQNQPNMQQQGQYGGMQANSLPGMNQFLTGANNPQMQGYSGMGQMHQTPGYPQQQQQQQQQQAPNYSQQQHVQQQYNQHLQQDPYQSSATPNQYNGGLNHQQQQQPQSLTSQLGSPPIQTQYPNMGASPPPQQQQQQGVYQQNVFPDQQQQLNRGLSATPSPAPPV